MVFLRRNDKSDVLKGCLCSIFIRTFVMTVVLVSVVLNLGIKRTYLLPNLQGILTSPKDI